MSLGKWNNVRWSCHRNNNILGETYELKLLAEEKIATSTELRVIALYICMRRGIYIGNFFKPSSQSEEFLIIGCHE